MKTETRLWIWVILLVLLLTGAISLGDIFSFILYTIGFIILMGLIGVLIFRYRIRRAQRLAEERGEPFAGYTWHFGGFSNTTRPQNPNEGRVKIKTGPRPKKRVNDDVGEYVDFKEN